MKLTAKAEEILEGLWIATEEGGQPSADFAALGIEAEDPGLLELLGLSYVAEHAGRVSLRPEGRCEARMTVRRHRLAERLMMDILDIQGQSGDERAFSIMGSTPRSVRCSTIRPPARTASRFPPGVAASRPVPPGRSVSWR
jgi:DtxR family Mn-dependent transcriptional regulator